MNAPVVAAVDVQRPLSLFASALAQRPLDVADALPARGERRALRLAALRCVVGEVEGEGEPPQLGGALPRRVLRWIDAARVDAIVAARYPGVRGDLRRAHAAALARPAPPAERRPLAAAVDGLRRWTLGAADDAPASDLHRALIEAARPGIAAGATPRDALVAACDVCRVLGVSQRRARAVRPVDAIEGDGPSDARGPGSEHAGAGDADESTDEAAGVACPADAGDAGGKSAALRGRARADTPAPSALRRHHDEWDYTARRYLRAWTCVHERRIAGTDLDYLATLRMQHAALAHEIRRGFATLPPQRRERVRRAIDGDAIDLDAAIAARVDRRAGQLGDGRVYSATQAARRDVSAAFLLDISASTGFAVEPDEAASADESDDDGPGFYAAVPRRALPPRAPRRRVIDVARDAIALMGDALERLGDRHAIYGYSGDGRAQVDFHVAKDFDDAWSARSAAALAALQPQGATRTGAALRHALVLLARERARTRLLILVTDGYPQDRDYGPQPRDIDYGVHDTAQALREAARAGVVALVICIDRAAHDHLRRVCAPGRYRVIDELDALPAQLAAVYRLMTAR